MLFSDFWWILVDFGLPRGTRIDRPTAPGSVFEKELLEKCRIVFISKTILIPGTSGTPPGTSFWLIFGGFLVHFWLIFFKPGMAKNLQNFGGTLPGSSQKLLSSPATIRRDPPWGTAIFAKRSKLYKS